MILASVEAGSPSKEEVLTLVGSAPSLRYLAEMNDSALRNVESQWHKLYIGWHSVLGQLKVHERRTESRSFLAQMLDKK